MTRLKPLPENSGFNMYTVAAVLVAWIVLLGFGFHYFYGPEAGAQSMGKIEKHELDATFGEGSIGKQRHDMLVEATRRYVAAHSDAPAAMTKGKQFAPEDFLNEDLAAHHAKFRVRHVRGTKAEIYEVS